MSNNPTKPDSEGSFKFEMSLIVGVSLLVCVVLFIAQYFELLPSEPLRPWLLWFYLSCAYVLASFQWTNPIGPDAMAVRTRFGKPIDVVGSGLGFAPLGIYRLERVKIVVNQFEFPEEPQNVFHGELREGVTLPEGKKPPIRVTFNTSLENDDVAKNELGKDFDVIDLHRVRLGKDDNEFFKMTYQEIDDIPMTPDNTLTFSTVGPTDGLSRRLTADVVLVVRWRIEEAILFIQKIGTDDRIKEANRQIEDEMISVLTRLLPKMSIAQALENTAWVNAHLFKSVTKRTLGWGIRVDGAYVKKFDTGQTVNLAIAQYSAAEFEGKRDKELTIAKGAGAAEAARALEEQTLVGRAAGQKKMIDDLGITGSEVIAAEVARSIAEGGNAVIFGADGMAQAASVVGAMVNKGNKPPSPEA